MRMLVIEADRSLAEAIAVALGDANIVSEHASAIAEAEELLANYTFDAVVLDLDASAGDEGMALLRRLRSAGNRTPVVVLSARADPHARVEGLKAGADDYIGKPFLFAELLARIEAVMRRVDDRVGTAITAGPFRYDLASGTATVAGSALPLSPRERKLLELLLRRKGRVVPAGAIQDQLCGLNDLISPNALEVSVHRLRKKLVQTGAGLTIENVRGIGYRLGAPHALHA